MHSYRHSGEFFAEASLRLYTALLAHGETEISRNLLRSTMEAAAAVNRTLSDGARAPKGLPVDSRYGLPADGSFASATGDAACLVREGNGDRFVLEGPGNYETCEELLKRSLFWICQVPDEIAQRHGGPAFKTGLALLLEVRRLQRLRFASGVAATKTGV